MLRAYALRLVGDDCGQDLIEYALLAGFISLTVAGAVAGLGTSIAGLFWDDMTAALNNAAN